MVGNEDRYFARVGDFADAGQYLSALRFRSLGGRLACERRTPNVQDGRRTISIAGNICQSGLPYFKIVVEFQPTIGGLNRDVIVKVSKPCVQSSTAN
jgi:hypothetical protein